MDSIVKYFFKCSEYIGAVYNYRFSGKIVLGEGSGTSALSAICMNVKYFNIHIDMCSVCSLPSCGVKSIDY